MAFGDYEDPRPRHEQIAADLRALIMSGDLEGEAPAVTALMDDFDAASSTVQRALAILRDEQLIKTRRGARTTVESDALTVIETGPYFDTDKVSYKLLQVSAAVPPTEVARAFARVGEKPDFTPAILRKRLMLDKQTERPIELSLSYYPAELVADTPLAGQHKIRGGAPRVLAEIGHRQAVQEDTVMTRPPTTEELLLLHLPPHVSVLRTLRVIRDADGRPVEVSILVKGGNRFALKDRQVL